MILGLRMSRCGLEPRAALAVAIMSVATLSVLRRAGAFRAWQFPRLTAECWLRPGYPKNARYRGAHVRDGPGPEGSSIPTVVHRTVNAEELKAEMIIVGDVHGCYDEMVTLLEKCGYRLGNAQDRGRFSVILVGDLVNKGPKNAQVVRAARTEGFLAVRGNHDNFVLSAVNGTGRFSRKAKRNGDGKPVTVPPWVSELSREDCDWLESLPYTLRFPSLGCIVVHAGLVPGVSLESQGLGAMTRMRNVVDKGSGKLEPREALGEGVPWAKAWRGPEHVYFGHDARRGFQKEAFATGLDTGCVYGKSLTAAVLPGRKVVCVPAEAQWTPPGG